MKLRTIVVAAVSLLLVAGFATTVATGATSDKGRRLAGPFCISLDTGVVRAVAVNQACRPGEVRKVGVAIPCRTLTGAIVFTSRGCVGPRGARGPKGDNGMGIQGAPGKDGAAGPAGKDGATGAPGPQGGPGPAGKVSVEQLTGEQSNCVKISGSDGSSGVICGTAGPKGDKGDRGPAGICECPKEGCKPKSH